MGGYTSIGWGYNGKNPKLQIGFFKLKFFFFSKKISKEGEKYLFIERPFLKILYGVWKQASSLIDVRDVWIVTYSIEFIKTIKVVPDRLMFRVWNSSEA